MLKLKVTELEKGKANRDEENARLSQELVRTTGRDGYMLVLQHDNEHLKTELKKLTAQIRVVNGTSSQAVPVTPVSPFQRIRNTRVTTVSTQLFYWI